MPVRLFNLLWPSLLNGIDAALRVKKRLPRVKLIFVPMHTWLRTSQPPSRPEAWAYVLKSPVGEELLDAVKSVLNGRTYVSSQVFRANLQRSSR